jgi:hypothetical protein
MEFNSFYTNDTLEAIRKELVAEHDAMHETSDWTAEMEQREQTIMARIRGLDELRYIYDQHIQQENREMAGPKEDVFALMGKIFHPAQ